MSDPDDYAVGWVSPSEICKEIEISNHITLSEHSPQAFDLPNNIDNQTVGRLKEYQDFLETLPDGKNKQSVVADIEREILDGCFNTEISLKSSIGDNLESGHHEVYVSDHWLHYPLLDKKGGMIEGLAKPELSKRPWTRPYTQSIHHLAGKNSFQADFSSGWKEYFVKGDVNRVPVEAFPDSGADMCFISPKLVSRLSLSPAPGTQKTIHLANDKLVQSSGMVKVSWRFAREQRTESLECWILPGCVHDLILGNRFLRATKTLTKFAHRIKSKFVELPRRLRLRLLGNEKQRLLGSLNGHHTAALPDTGSDVMLISSAYAREIGLVVDRDLENWLEIEFADGSTGWTSGVVRDVSWNVGGRTVRCDFHVLDKLSLDVILSKNYLFDLNIFSEHDEWFFNTNSKDDFSELCNIRLIGRYGDTLHVLEDEYLEDINSAEAFSPDMVQRELARRDQIRDEIWALPEDEREAATQAEAERRRRWEDIKQAHRRRWATEPSAPQTLSGHSSTHRTMTYRDRTRASERSLTDEGAGDDHQVAVTRRVLRKIKVTIQYISLKLLERRTRA